MSLEPRFPSICDISVRVYVSMMASNMLDFGTLRTFSMYYKRMLRKHHSSLRSVFLGHQVTGYHIC
jgi:hypothetical protein